MDLEQKLAEGRTAEIFAWGTGRVLKLYRREFLTSAIEREFASAQAAFEAGVPTPQPLAIVERAERRGIVFARVAAPTMLAALLAAPERMPQYAHQLAALHVELHARRVAALPVQRKQLMGQIAEAAELSPRQKERALITLADLPDGDALCHGDFHPNNILLAADGPLIIDWVDAMCGHPLADVARTLLLLRTAYLAPNFPAPAREGLQRFYDLYLTHYLNLQQVDREAVMAWTLPVAAARLSEGVGAAEAQQLVTLVDELSIALG